MALRNPLVLVAGQITELPAGDSLAGSGSTLSIVGVSATSYSIQSSDSGKLISSSAATAATYTVTSQPAGTVIYVYQSGAGRITFVGDTGVVLRTKIGLKSNDQYSLVTLMWLATGEVLVGGDITNN